MWISPIAKEREKIGWTQEKLAEKAGISREYIAMLETNIDANPTKKTMEKIALALKKNPSDIFFVTNVKHELLKESD